MPTKQVIAWPALIAVWILTPMMGDRTPTALVVTYWVLMVAAVAYGLYVAIKQRSWPLGIFSVLTVFAWPIILFIIFSIFGIA